MKGERSSAHALDVETAFVVNGAEVLPDGSTTDGRPSIELSSALLALQRIFASIEVQRVVAGAVHDRGRQNAVRVEGVDVGPDSYFRRLAWVCIKAPGRGGAWEPLGVAGRDEFQGLDDPSDLTPPNRSWRWESKPKPGVASRPLAFERCRPR